MSEKELKKYLRPMQDKISKRMKRFADVTELPSKQHKALRKKPISMKGKNSKQLINEIIRADNFLSLRTSSKKEYNKIMKEGRERFAKLDVEISETDFWRVFKKMNEIQETTTKGESKGRVLFLAEQLKTKTPQQILDDFMQPIDEFEEEYEDF